MCRRLRQATSIALLAALLIVLAPAAEGTADPAGTVHFVRPANTEFNSFTSNPSPEGQAWLRSHMWRMLVWSPYFDSKTAAYTLVTLKGSLVVNAGGTLAVQAAQNTAAGGGDASTVLLGAYGTFRRVL